MQYSYESHLSKQGNKGVPQLQATRLPRHDRNQQWSASPFYFYSTPIPQPLLAAGMREKTAVGLMAGKTAVGLMAGTCLKECRYWSLNRLRWWCFLGRCPWGRRQSAVLGVQRLPSRRRRPSM